MNHVHERRAQRPLGQRADVVELTADMVREILSCGVLGKVATEHLGASRHKVGER